MNEDEDEYEIKEKLLQQSNEMNTRSSKKVRNRNSCLKQMLETNYINEFEVYSPSKIKKANSVSFNADEELQEKPTHNTNTNILQQSGQKYEIQQTEQSKNLKQASVSINNSESRQTFTLYRYIQDFSQGINLACFCYFYCTTVSNSTPKWPFSGIIGYMIGSLTNLSMGSSRYVVYVPSFLAINFIRTMSESYDQEQINVITALSGVYLFLFSRYLDIQRLVFFVPAIVLLGYVYSIVFQFFFNYIDFTLGFRTFNDIGDYYKRFLSVISHAGWYSLFIFALTGILVLFFLIAQVKYRKYPWLTVFLALSWLLGIFFIDKSQSFNVIQELYEFKQPKWSDIFSYLIKPITSFYSFRLILLIEALELAVLIYLESLFTLNFSEKECSDKDIEPQREVLVLSIANIISGLFCGIPVSAGIFSTTLNGVVIRRNSKYPRLISLVVTIVMEFIVCFYRLSIPYLCFGSVLFSVSIFALYMNLYFHANATQRNLEVWTQAVIGFFYNPIISAILCTSYTLLQNELNRYTLQRRSIYANSSPNGHLNNIFNNNNNNHNNSNIINVQNGINNMNNRDRELQVIQQNTNGYSQNDTSHEREQKQTLPNRITLEPHQLATQQIGKNPQCSIFNHDMEQSIQNRHKYKRIVEKYNMLNDKVVSMQDNSQAHPNNIEESFLQDFEEEEFQQNKFMLARYHEQSDYFEEYKTQGVESFLRTDSSFLIQTIEGEITCDYLKYIQEQIGSKLYLSLDKYRGIILKFKNITFYDMNSLFQTKVLMCFLSKKYLPVLVTGMPEQLAEDLFALNPQMFKADSIILELKK